MTAKTPAETHPIHASHLGVPKSKAENETRAQPAASARWMATADPLPSSIWVKTAMGSASKRTSDPSNPRSDRIPEPLETSCCAATPDDVPAPPDPTPRG